MGANGRYLCGGPIHAVPAQRLPMGRTVLGSMALTSRLGAPDVGHCGAEERYSGRWARVRGTVGERWHCAQSNLGLLVCVTMRALISLGYGGRFAVLCCVVVGELVVGHDARGTKRCDATSMIHQDPSEPPISYRQHSCINRLVSIGGTCSTKGEALRVWQSVSCD